MTRFPSLSQSASSSARTKTSREELQHPTLSLTPRVQPTLSKQPRPQPLLRVNLTSADVSPRPARTPSADRSPSPSPRTEAFLHPNASPRAEISPRPEGTPRAESSPRAEPLSRSQSSPRKELTPNTLRRIRSLQSKKSVPPQQTYRARLSAEERERQRLLPQSEPTETERALRALPTIPSAQAVAMTTSEPMPEKPGTSDVLS
jgi:hypothetical protein